MVPTKKGLVAKKDEPPSWYSAERGRKKRLSDLNWTESEQLKMLRSRMCGIFFKKKKFNTTGNGEWNEC